MLQALRNCIVGAGNKMSDAIRKQITTTLEGLLSSTDDTTRTTAAACLGALCSCLKEDELAVVLHMHLLGWLPHKHFKPHRKFYWLIWYSTKRAYVIMICPSCIVVVWRRRRLCTALLATGFRIETSYLV